MDRKTKLRKKELHAELQGAYRKQFENYHGDK